MDAQQIQEALLRQHNIRIGLQMADYVRDQLSASSAANDKLPVIGRDARTGFPLRAIIAVNQLQPLVTSA